MKALNTYINEKLVLNKNTFKKPEYKYFPENEEELLNIINQLLKERKNDDVIDLNDIDISKVVSLKDLFGDMDIKNIDISKWNTSKVTDMTGMFYNCKNLESVGDLSEWDVSRVTCTESMFSGCKYLKYIGDLDSWNVSRVENMSFMFYFCSNLKSIGDISGWNTERVEDMTGMFYNCKNLESVGNLDDWDLSCMDDISYIEYMFKGSNITNLPKWYKE